MWELKELILRKPQGDTFDHNGGNAINQTPIPTVATTKVNDTLQSGDVGSPGPATPMNPMGAGGNSQPGPPTFPIEPPPNFGLIAAVPEVLCPNKNTARTKKN